MEKFEACGGPKKTQEDRGHIAGETPAGHYTLGPQHHHVTLNWQNSCIPWGAAIRRATSGEVEFDDGGGWRPATGVGAPMNRALTRKRALAKLPPYSPEELRSEARSAFLENPDNPHSPLVDVWLRNDFGVWAFNLRRNGRGTPYYIHTTPEDEAAGWSARLGPSHGCIHIRPSDRDKMIRRHYLEAGVELDVKAYDAVRNS